MPGLEEDRTSCSASVQPYVSLSCPGTSGCLILEDPLEKTSSAALSKGCKNHLSVYNLTPHKLTHSFRKPHQPRTTTSLLTFKWIKIKFLFCSNSKRMHIDFSVRPEQLFCLESIFSFQSRLFICKKTPTNATFSE